MMTGRGSMAVFAALFVFALVWTATNRFNSAPVASTDVTVRNGAPGVTNDVDEGFLPGYVWIDQSTANGYIAISTTLGAADWDPLSGTALTGAVYGEIYEDDGSTTQVLNTINVWEVVEELDTAGLSSAVTLDPVTDNDIVVSIAGDYMVSFNASFTGSNSTDYEIAVFVNGAEQHVKTDRRIGTGTDVGSASASGLLTLDALDAVDLRVRSVTNNSDNFILQNGSLSVLRVDN